MSLEISICWSRGICAAETEVEAMRELELLNRVSEALNRSRLQPALERCLELLTEVLDCQTGWVWLLDESGERYFLAASHRLPAYLQEPVRMTGSSCWCLEQLEQGQLTPSNIHVLACSRMREAPSQEGLRYHASLPLQVGDRTLGVMNLTGPAWRKQEDWELSVLSSVAYQIGLAVERERLQSEALGLAREQERLRLARDLHDTVAQGLSGVAMQLEGARDCLDSKPDKARRRLERALEIVRESLQGTRQAMEQLRSAPSLLPALEKLAHAWTSRTGVPVSLHLNPCVLTMAVETELLRVAEQALDNAARHARARQVQLRLEPQNGQLKLVVADDGCGFDPAAVDPSRFGLVGMAERTRLLGGDFHLRSQRDGGTRIEVTVPL